MTRRTPEDLAKQGFGERAAFYTTSAAHTDPTVLARVVELAQPQSGWTGLDIATGAGHTALALAPHLRSMIAVDLTAEMLREARGLRDARGVDNLALALADVHALPFADASFDVVACRRAAHHFSRIDAALREMRRVLRRGGRLVIDDRSVPEDGFIDRTMNALDTLHDPSHVREYRASEWRAMLERAGFTLEALEGYVINRPLSALSGDVPPERAAQIEAVLRGLDPEQRQAMGYVDVAGDPHLNHWYVMLAGVRPSD